MTRSVPLWIGATDDTAIPPRVRARVFERCHGKCHYCGRKIPVGDKWIMEHLVALINGGTNSEDNLCLTCSYCKPIKDAADVAVKAKVAAVRNKHLLPRAPSRLSSPGFRKSPPQHTATSPIVRKSERQS